MEKPTTAPASASEFTVLFTSLRDPQHDEVVRQSETIARQAETISLLAESISAIEEPQFTTSFSN